MNTISKSIVGLTCLLAITSCELFTIGGGSRGPVQIERSQRSSAGVAHLITAEIDSGNTVAATELMVHSSGRQLLAVEKFELADEIQRWETIMAGKPISSTVVDTISDSTHKVRITLDYVRTMQFYTLRKGSLWWVTKITDAPKR